MEETEEKVEAPVQGSDDRPTKRRRRSSKKVQEGVVSASTANLKPVINIYKPISKTPLETVMEFKLKFPEYAKDPTTQQPFKIGYAGRLDPMAHGVLILLVGEENKKRKEYEFCTKDYTWEMVLGWQTDTYDTLGMVSSPVECAACKWSNDDELTQQVNQIVSKQIGKQVQKYPPYSSVRVNGKLLFQWAKENKLDSIEIPSKTIEIFSLSLKSITKIPLSSFISQTHSRIDGISPQNNGKFREPEIKRKWDQVLLANDPNMDLTVLTFNAFVSHGAYVRSIAQDIGLQLGTGAVVVDLLRTRVGEHLLDQSLRV